MPYSCKLEQPAVLKVLAHAAKFPANSINGLLLGTATPDGVAITDAVPLCHTTLALAPATEIGLAQVDCYAQSSGQQVVGYYQADARFQAGDLTPVGRKVADRIYDRQPGAAVLVLDNKKLEQFCKSQLDSPFDVFSKDGSKGWKREGDALIQLGGGGWPALREEFFAMFKQQKHRDLVDFEEHLDDAQKDYINKAFGPSAKFALPGNVM